MGKRERDGDTASAVSNVLSAASALRAVTQEAGVMSCDVSWERVEAGVGVLSLEH